MNISDLNTLEFNRVKGKYGYVEFNGITLYVTSDKKWFCATRLYRSLKYDKNCADSAANGWWKNTMKPRIETN